MLRVIESILRYIAAYEIEILLKHKNYWNNLVIDVTV